MTFVMKYSREPQSTTTGADTSCVPKWQWDNCRALLQVQSQAVFPNGNGTTAEHYYRCSHKLCSQMAMGQLHSTTTGAVTSCVPNGDRTTAEHYYRCSHKLCSQMAMGQHPASSPIYPNQHWHRLSSYVSIACKNEYGCLLICDVMQSDRLMQTFRRNLQDPCSEQNIGVSADYPKRRYVTRQTVWNCSSL